MSLRKKILIGIAWGVILALLIALLGAGNFFYDLAFVRGPKDFLNGEESMGDESQEARQETRNQQQAWLDGQRTQTIEITSDDGLKLVGTYIYAHVPAGRTAILVHGYTANRQSMLGFAYRFVEEMGYNVLIPDLRGQGDSEGDTITYGWIDRLDIKQWIRRAIEEHGRDEQIVLFGISMGGAAVMMTAGEELSENVKAVIEDCGYTSVKDELTYQLKQLYGLPSFPLIPVTSLVARHRAGFYLGTASAVNQLRKTALPVLFIHGEADAFVPYEMVHTLYEAAAGPKEIYTVPDAAHGEAYSANPDQYMAVVQRFLNQYVAQ